MYYTGVVEDRTTDPLKLGRCKVRVLGLHNADKVDLPTSDLPWAVIMQPVTSAAISGVGQSPTGFVEGTHVIVIFRDQDLQQPIVIGSIAGIPVKEPSDKEVEVVTTAESLIWTTDFQDAPEDSGVTDSSGTPVTDGSGNPVQSGTPKAPAPEGTSPKNPTIKKPDVNLKPSEDCFDKIREEEKFSSLEPGKNKFISYAAFKKLSPGTKIYPYKDTVGKWTIGWGSRFLKSGKSDEVNENTAITAGEADAAMKSTVNDYFAPEVRKKLTAPVTQSMFDTMVSTAYNMGMGNFGKSSLLAAVNTADYEKAAGLLLVTATNGGSLSARREREQKLFVKDGFPNKDMSAVTPSPQEKSAKAVNDATQNPVVKPLAPGATPSSSSGGGGDSGGGGGQKEKRKLEGFKDPAEVYPKFFDEPDTHRLARHEKIDQTVVFLKEAARAKGIISGGKGKWSQPPIPYNAKYPYNQIRVTESGHVQEFDDTEGNERIHTYHRSGTYEEIDKNGTRVNRIVGDMFEIMERNGNVVIRGSLNVTIIGNQNIRVENDANIDVLGNVNMTVGGDYNLGVTGNANFNVGGKFSVASGNKIMMNAGAPSSWDAPKIDLNSGRGSGLSNPQGKGSAGGLPNFPVLETPTRADEILGQYETPEDGDSTEFNKSVEKSGLDKDYGGSDYGGDSSSSRSSTPDPKEQNTMQKAEEEKPAEDTSDKKKPTPKVTDCSAIPEKGDIDLNFQLSPNFKLKDLNGSRLSGGLKVSITRAEAVCNLKKLAENCLEPIKSKYPNMKITSGLRTDIPSGGSATSDHLYGCAADFQLSGFSRKEHYEASIAITKLLPAWTQVIFEINGGSTWIHVSYNEKRSLRMEKFTMVSHKRTSPNLFTIVSA